MKKVKRGRGRPPLSAAEKARRAKERETLKMGAAPKRRGRPAGKPGRKPGKSSLLNLAQVVTFANSLLSHEQFINNLITASGAHEDSIRSLNEFNAKAAETIAKLTEAVVDLTNRLQKIEDAVDFSSTDAVTSDEKPKRTKKVEIPNGEAGVGN